jgi:predicted enzyme related to lactoylglutathione lyase
MSRPIHFELPADDPERCARFYADAFGWNVEAWGGPTEYWLVTTGEPSEAGIDGGIGRRSDPDEGVVNTIGVDSVDEAVARILASGGSVTRPKASVRGVGWLAYCTDTEGNPFGIMQADPSAP